MADRTFTLKRVRCVGSCGLAPVAVLDDAVAGKLTTGEAVRRIQQWQEEKKEVAA